MKRRIAHNLVSYRWLGLFGVGEGVGNPSGLWIVQDSRWWEDGGYLFTYIYMRSRFFFFFFILYIFCIFWWMWWMRGWWWRWKAVGESLETRRKVEGCSFSFRLAFSVASLLYVTLGESRQSVSVIVSWMISVVFFWDQLHPVSR